MTGEAILMMLVAILVIWGGLVGSVVALRRMDPPFQKGEDYSGTDFHPHPGLTESDFVEKEAKEAADAGKANEG
ncbi:methionine/alanine import family NSS transporter small subunit [Varibaculum cambriense]|uniref:methionine/alanine import family NSS transporter small subunit n=1 Tax=Varibaculum cambriense TaxID=184870 RepID=UPI00290102A1|nr:methionine/alanine import family NSS transporter small subunit [Varibaculum cambriense]MDU1224395.1 methionine/alanine import family NSS transporter small subunit [Varibaculum cambriense]MDU3275056.1 methionine/alanine import family NSS transporter small subunit [Varibaculum cambriense]